MVNVECECINHDNSVINYGILAHSAQAQLKLLFLLSVLIQTKMIAWLALHVVRLYAMNSKGESVKSLNFRWRSIRKLVS